MTDGDSVDMANDLGIDATWYEVSTVDGGALRVDAANAKKAIDALDTLAADPTTKYQALFLETLGGGEVRTSYGWVTTVMTLTPGFRRHHELRVLLEDRERRAVRAEFKVFGDADEE